MSIERELARARAKGSAEDVNRRHRQAQEAARRVADKMKSPSSPNGIDPGFQAQLDAAAKRGRVARDAKGAALDRMATLRAQGHLPPAEPEDVGYEPTAEEVLGELAESHPPESDPEQLEQLPTAEEVLSAPREEVPETEATTYRQLNPALRGAIEKAALETGRGVGKSSGKHSKRHKR